MKKERIHTATMIMGIATALVVVFSQVFFFQATQLSKKEIKTEKKEKQKAEDETYLTLPSFSMPSSVHVEVTNKSFCLFEILFEDNQEETRSHTVPLSLGKFFHTLFRVIIAPNAP